MNLFEGYDLGIFYDEMFAADGGVRPHCGPLQDRFREIDPRDFLARKASSELYFLRQGITFNVYHDDRGTERIFPFDPIPRVMPAGEWEHLEAGLTQRIVALNLFLHDIYHDQRILKDGVIPRFYIEQAKHYRPEFRGVDVPADIYIHICGSDLIRGGDGQYYVLEDNGRCPSGASYLLENRNALK
ncbi:MAG: circularly permuted type 2 ATP-grasp protein, partial [Verrucomicrobia bacterium]|nr:circularly permuted type 2 ATP-grasp protein [Verrucomicrobiota bacterium]